VAFIRKATDTRQTDSYSAVSCCAVERLGVAERTWQGLFSAPNPGATPRVTGPQWTVGKGTFDQRRLAPEAPQILACGVRAHHTARPRSGERDGEHYFFLKRPRFEQTGGARGGVAG